MTRSIAGSRGRTGPGELATAGNPFHSQAVAHQHAYEHLSISDQSC